MGFPSVELQIAFASDPMNGSPTWTTIANSYVRGFNTRRGRNHELDRIEAGTATVRLRNKDRRFDPTYASSPYYPNVKPMKQMRLRATWNAVTYDLYRGFIESWPPNWPGAKTSGDAEVEISCVDALGVLALINLTAYSTEVLADEPVGYWKLNETIGTTATNLGSAESADGTYINTPALNQAGPLLGGAGAVALDGTSSEYVNITGVPAALSIAGDLTLETFIWIDPTAGTAHFLWGPNSYGLTYDASDTLILLGETDGIFDGLTGWDSGISEGAWHHLVVTRNASTRKAMAWLDGVPMTEGGVAEQVAYVPSGSLAALYLGSGVASGGWLKGRLAHVAIYDKVLTPERIAAHYNAGTDEVAPQASGDVMEAILTAAGWPAALTSIDAGVSTLQGGWLLEGNALELLREVEASEDGLLYVSAGGVIGFHERHAITKAPHNASAVTFGDAGGSELPYKEISPSYDVDQVRNRIRGTRDNGVPQLAEDTTSQTAYGIRDLEIDRKHLSSDEELKDAVNYKLGRYKDPALRIDSMVLTPHSVDAMWPSLLAREVHFDRVTVKKQPPGGGTIAQESHVQAIAHDVTGDRRWIATMQLSPADAQTFWILGDATYGVLGSTARLGY